MPYSIEWYVPNRLILEKAFGNLTIEELLRFNAEVTQIIADEGVTPVHIIADLSKVERYPSSLREIMNTMRQSNPEKIGWMVVVTENPILRFLASTVFQMARLRLRIFPTMTQATAFLNEMDETLGLTTQKDQREA